MADRDVCFAQGWYCPDCGEGHLQDILDHIDKSGDPVGRLVFDITKNSVRYWCPDCAAIFGEAELKKCVLGR